MSEQKARETINAIIDKAIANSPALLKLKQDYRSNLNTKYHILDISRESLKVNLVRNTAASIDLYNRSWEEFIAAISKYVPPNRQFDSIDKIEKLPLVGTVYVKKDNILISLNFDAARDFISNISKKIPNNRYFGLGKRSTKSKTKSSKVDLGHIEDFADSNKNTVLGYSLTDILGSDLLSGSVFEEFDDVSESTKDTILKEASSTLNNIVKSHLESLSEIHAICDYAFKNEIPEKLQTLTGQKGFLVLTLHLHTLNNDLSIAEKTVYDKVLSEVHNAIANFIKSIPGSNTVEQDLVSLVRQHVVNGIKGTTNLALEKHSLVKGSFSSKKGQGKKTSIDGKSVTMPRSTTLRTKKGQFISLTNIKNMINLQLMEQVANNMGKGNAKSILNFRTGRFAASAHVEQLVRNKDDTLTAYYTYLKYPYATFQPGGRQGYPESRDPRLLISKSIRQLAAQQMAERLKTICV